MSKRVIFSTILTLIVIVGSLLAGCASQPAASPGPAQTATKSPQTSASPSTTSATDSATADFYKGKAFTIGVTAGTGSMTDLYSRLIAARFSQLTGARAGVVNNTAAGGMAYFNEFANVTKPDGLTVLFLSIGAYWRPWLSDDPAVKYDPTKVEYLGGSKNGNYILSVSPKGNIKTVDDLKKAKGIKFAASAANNGLTLTTLLAIEVLKLDAKVITGYSGTDAWLLALAQGEVDGMVDASDGSAKNAKNGLIRPIFQMGLKRAAPWNDLPCIAEVAEQTDSNIKLLKTLDAFADYKMIIAPAGTPPDRVKFLADAFAAVYSDKTFLDTVESTTGTPWLGSLTRQDCQDIEKGVPDFKPTMAVYNDLTKKYISK